MQAQKEYIIAVTGAAGNIAQAFYPLLGSGQVFGDIKFHLNLLEIEARQQELEGIKMQMEDCAFPLLTGVTVTSDPAVAFKNIDIGIFLGGVPRKPGMERSDLLHMNADIFLKQGKILNEIGKPTAKILVVANPSNTNCATLAATCPKIPKSNFTSLMQLDHNRCLSTLAREANATIDEVQKVAIWGNHSLTQYPDVSQSIIKGQKASELFPNDYLRNALIQQVQKRGGQILQVSKGTSTISGAIAVKDHLKNWHSGTNGQWTSFGVVSDGKLYGIPEGLCFSVPVTCKDFEAQVVSDIELDEFSKQKIEQSIGELLREKSQAD